MRLRDLRQEFESAGVDVLVASAHTVDEVQAAASRFDLPFPMVADDGALMDALGLRHHGAGPGGGDTFYATSFLLDRNGVVREAFVPTNLRRRADPADVLALAAALPGDGPR